LIFKKERKTQKKLIFANKQLNFFPNHEILLKMWILVTIHSDFQGTQGFALQPSALSAAAKAAWQF